MTKPSHRYRLWLPIVIGQLVGVLVVYYFWPVSNPWSATDRFFEILHHPLTRILARVCPRGPWSPYYVLFLFVVPLATVLYWTALGLVTGLLWSVLAKHKPHGDDIRHSVGADRRRLFILLPFVVLVVIGDLLLLVFGVVNAAARTAWPPWPQPVAGADLTSPTRPVIDLFERANDPMIAPIVNFRPWSSTDEQSSALRGFFSAIHALEVSGGGTLLYSFKFDRYEDAVHATCSLAERALREGRFADAADWYSACARADSMLLVNRYFSSRSEWLQSLRAVAPVIAVDAAACHSLDLAMSDAQTNLPTRGEIARVRRQVAQTMARGIFDGTVPIPPLYGHSMSRSGYTAVVDRIAMPVPLFRALLGSTRSATSRHIDAVISYDVSPGLVHGGVSLFENVIESMGSYYTGCNPEQDEAFGSGDDPVAKRVLRETVPLRYVSRVIDADLADLCATRFHLAIRRFQAEHTNTPPAALSELVPRYLPAMPDADSTNRFQFATSGTNWIVYIKPGGDWVSGYLSPIPTNHPFVGIRTNRQYMCWPSDEVSRRP